MMREEHEAPVLLVRTGPEELTAVMTREAPAGWHRLADSALSAVAPFLRGGQLADTGHLSARTFRMRPEDEAVWDIHRKHTTGDYAYGVLVAGDGKFVKNVALKEVVAPPASDAAGGSSLDPSAVAAAAAMAQIQASIERLAEMVEQIGLDVKEVLTVLHLEQEADVLAAVEAVDESYRSYLSTGRFGSVDWDVVAPLGHVLKKQHRQIVGELSTLPKTLGFQSISEAQAAERIDPQRISNLVTLECFLLRSLARWTELNLAAKASRGELQTDDARDARQSMTKYVSTIRDLLGLIHKTDSAVNGRSWWDQLFTHGIVLGRIRDDKIRQVALDRRDHIKSIVANYKQLPNESRTMLSSLLPKGQFTSAVPSPANGEGI